MYPVFRIDERGRDLHQWLRQLEETQLFVLSRLGLVGRRFSPHTGVWIENEKVAAIGIQVRRWVSFHGIALNCDVDLSPFERIVPCGIQGYGVTRLSRALARQVSVGEVKPLAAQAFRDVFSSGYA
jgi:lipoyl(octanoyl) transferase